jgi:LPXTG-motif cell wall-anchored protein
VAEVAGLVASGVTLLLLILIGLFMWKRRKSFSNPSSPAAPGTPAASESAQPKSADSQAK